MKSLSPFCAGNNYHDDRHYGWAEEEDGGAGWGGSGALQAGDTGSRHKNLLADTWGGLSLIWPGSHRPAGMWKENGWVWVQLDERMGVVVHVFLFFVCNLMFLSLYQTLSFFLVFICDYALLFVFLFLSVSLIICLQVLLNHQPDVLGQSSILVGLPKWPEGSWELRP